MAIKNLKTFLRVFLSFGLIILLIYLMKDDLEKITSSLLNANKVLFFLSFLIYILVLVVISFRLKWIMKVQRGRITFKEAVTLNFIGHFFSSFLPTAIGGDVFRAYFIYQKTGNKIGSYTAVFVDRFIGLITTVFIASSAIIFVKGAVPAKVKGTVIVLLVISLLAALIFLNRRLAKSLKILRDILKFLKLHTKIETVYNAINIYKNHKYIIVKSLILTLICQIVSFYLIFLLSKALSINIPLKVIFFLMPLVSFMSMLPSIGGLGFREGAFIVFFGPIITKELAFSLSLLWLGIIILTSIIGGIIYSIKGNFKIKLEEVQND